MKRKLLSRRPSAAMVVALVALFSSLVGGATAARLITGKDIRNSSITQKDIRKNAVRSKQVKNRSLKAKDFKKRLLIGSAVKMSRGGPNNFTPLNSGDQTEVARLTVRAPARGFVALSYSATINNDTPNTWLEVFLTEGRTRLNGVEWWEPGDADGNYDTTQGNQLVVPVRRGRHTYSLALRMSAGTAGAHDARMTAQYFRRKL